MPIIIRSLQKKDISAVVEIASRSFSGLKEKRAARRWVVSNVNASGRMRYFVAADKTKILGYSLWVEKGGFRKESVWELEQIAVHPEVRGRGLGTLLITRGLKKIQEILGLEGRKLKIVEVTTGTDNQAQELYRRTLGAKPECVVKDLFRGDEVVMIARFK